MRAAAAGGALSRAALVEATSGPEKRALRWALRDAGDRPLSAERCRAAAADLVRLPPATWRVACPSKGSTTHRSPPVRPPRPR